MIEFRNPYHIIPPGSDYQILSHPTHKNDIVELAIFQEHRYAFFYWLKWTTKLDSASPPCLVSLDWHQDLCYPCATEKEWLSQLDLGNDGDVAMFSWAKLAGNNDGHILSAAYLNLIGNIYVHCRQGTFESSWEDEELVDIDGKIHLIKKFRTLAELEQQLLMANEPKVYFDIDLDFFTINNPYAGEGKKFSYMTKEEIENLISPKTPFMQWIFQRLEGFTIATEPKHCGGLIKSNMLLNVLSKKLFKPDLFSKDCEWRHKT